MNARELLRFITTRLSAESAFYPEEFEVSILTALQGAEALISYPCEGKRKRIKVMVRDMGFESEMESFRETVKL